MTAIQLNNLWTYIQGMALKKKDREWLAGKLLEPTADDAKTAQQKAYVKESLYRALDEVERAKRGEHKMMTEEEFLEGLKKEGITCPTSTSAGLSVKQVSSPSTL